jgi:hypothetical protein
MVNNYCMQIENANLTVANLVLSTIAKGLNIRGILVGSVELYVNLSLSLVFGKDTDCLT